MDKETIENMGSKYLKESLLAKKIPPFEYERNRIPIGKTKLEQIFYLEFPQPMRILIIGKSGAGKTYLLRAIVDRLKQTPILRSEMGSEKKEPVGYDIFIPTDIKDEFKSSNKPIQAKFRNGLLYGEKPKISKTLTLRPTFFKEKEPRLAPDNRWMSVNLKDMQKRDFFTLLNAEDMTDAQQGMLEQLFDLIKKKEDFMLSDITTLIDQLADYKDAQTQALKNKFKPLLNSEFGDPKYNRELLKVFKEDYTLPLNMEDYDYFGKGGILYPEVTIGMMLRNVRNLRIKKLINPLYVIVDEAARFVPESSNPSCKLDFLEGLDVDRRYNIGYIYASQEITDLPPKIKAQCRYIFIPHNVNTEVIKQCLIFTGMVTRGHIQNAQNDANKIRAQLGKWQWLVIDQDLNRMDIINVLPPLSEHMETS